MTPAQRLAHALYGSHGPAMVAGAQAFAKRLLSDGYAIVPVEMTDAMVDAAVSADHGKTLGSRVAHAHAAAIQAYQQEIET